MAVVLHVDDKEANRYTVRRMLVDAAYDVLEAETGAEGLKLATAGADIVLLDLHLPDLHGLEVCRRLRADPATARLPIVHLTATYGPRELWAEALEAGADAYLTYPVEPPVLLGTMQSLLRARAAEKAQGLAETARQASERRLELSQRRLAEAQQIAHLGSFERDLRTGAIVASDEIFRIYGFEPGQGSPSYDDFLSRMHPDERDAVDEANRRAGADGRPLGLEARVVRPDGSLRVVAVRGEVIPGEDGQPTRLVGIVQDITERKQVEEQRRALLERVLRVQEDERRNLARELHDEVGQSLTALKLMLDARPVPDTAARRQAMRKDAAGIVDDLLRRIRNLSLDLRPPMLDDLGLMVALTWHLDRYRERTGIRVRLDARGVSGRFPLDLETTAFRVVQEALTNVARHASAGEASVEVRAEPAGVVVSVADDGGGFDSVSVLATATGGLAGLRERVGLLGGSVHIASSPGAGTRVEARIPTRPPANP